MVNAVLGEFAALGVDDEASLVVTPRLQSSKHAFAQAHVLGLQHVALVVHRVALLLARLGVRQVPVLVFDRPPGTGRNDLQVVDEQARQRSGLG